MYVINGLTNFDLLQICDPILLKGSWSKYDKFLISQSKVYGFFHKEYQLDKISFKISIWLGSIHHQQSRTKCHIIMRLKTSYNTVF